ncbi:hypothetical protein [Streptomyces reniochalinae]|uniref:hypothetical protein n=1 Tax=Streptomyces reniochalinae TaxID=2250578 RepID=UPI0026BC60E7
MAPLRLRSLARLSLPLVVAAQALVGTAAAAAAPAHDGCAQQSCGRSVVVAPLSQEPPSTGPCTSPEKVVCMIRAETPQERAESRETRMRYHALLGEMDRKECAMRAEGRSEEDIARTLVRMRNDAKDITRAGMSSEEVKRLEERNRDKYGNPLGPTADQLHAKYGSWKAVSDAATRSSEAVDSELGLAYRPCPCEAARADAEPSADMESRTHAERAPDAGPASSEAVGAGV